jgi:DNA mismatch repair protein MutL
MGKIQQLDSHLTNMIAAGEVVERPMGVIKELIENSIDAHATSIDVYISEAGLASMIIKDNGDGMDSQDATLAFKRHSTSKLHSEEDLLAISSLGFRGEALPSIASVSECIVTTSNNEESTKVTIHYGQLTEAIPYSCEKGTTIEIKGLFLKTPARLKHMKSLPYEQALVLDVVQRFAISYPHIAFSLSADQKEILSTNGSGNQSEVIYRIYGRDVAKEAISFTNSDSDFNLSGILVKPSISRATRRDMHVFMNKRMVRSSRIQRAIIDGYKHFMPADRYPIAFLFVEVDLKLIDVNVHPSKWEIRLSKEKQLIELIEKSIHKTLSTTPQVKPARAFSTSTSQQAIQEPLALFETCTPKMNFLEEQAPEVYEIEPSNDYVRPMAFRVLSQMHKKYILAENEEGLFIFDQHASMERIRYEYFKKQRLNTIHNQQPLLVPITISDSKALTQADDLIALFRTFQIALEFLHEDTLIIRSLPDWLTNTDEKKAIDDIIDYFHNGQHKTEEDLRKKVLSTLACHSSIRFNDLLSMGQMQQLVNDLMMCEQPYHCPHGRPTYIKLTSKDLEKEFLR